MNREEMILCRVRELRQRHPFVGVRKLQLMLRNEKYGYPILIGRDRLFALLQKYSLLSAHRRKYVQTTNSKHKNTIYPNLLSGLSVSAVNQVWVSDITYLRLANGKFSYLFLVTDFFSRKIIGYRIDKSLSSDGAISALQMAIRNTKPAPGLIHHSDHGVQYSCKEYVYLLKKIQANISMTGPKHCYDNAVAERVNGILKQEYCLGLSFASHEAAIKLVKSGIELYNTERLHHSLQYSTPNAVYEKFIKNNKQTISVI